MGDTRERWFMRNEIYQTLVGENLHEAYSFNEHLLRVYSGQSITFAGDGHDKWLVKKAG
jgi:hypothetical protein